MIYFDFENSRLRPSQETVHFHIVSVIVSLIPGHLIIGKVDESAFKKAVIDCPQHIDTDLIGFYVKPINDVFRLSTTVPSVPPVTDHMNGFPG